MRFSLDDPLHAIGEIEKAKRAQSNENKEKEKSLVVAGEIIRELALKIQ